MPNPSQVVITGIRRPLGYQQISAATLATAQKLTIPALTGALAGLQVGRALIQANGGTIRWRDDGTAPTSAIGMLMVDGVILDYAGDFTAIQLILSSSTPTADITYYA